MPERDEVQAARWDAIRHRIGDGLRGMRGHNRSQAQLAWEMDELGFHISQSMVSRYEQGQGEVPLTLERMVGWALCCDALSSEHLREVFAEWQRRTERWAAKGQRPLACRRHKQSAGTACVRLQFT